MRVAFVSLRTPHHVDPGTAPRSGNGSTGDASPRPDDAARSEDSTRSENPAQSVDDSQVDSDSQADADDSATADTRTTAAAGGGSATSTASVPDAAPESPTVTRSGPPQTEMRGIERMDRVARLLADRGHEVVVLCAQWWDGRHPRFEQGGVTYWGITDDLSIGGFVSKLPFAIQAVDPDVIQVANSPPGAVVAARMGGLSIRVPIVVDWWCDREADSPSRYRWAVRSADAIVTPSRTVRTQVREHGADPDDVYVVPESIDFSLVEEAGVDNRADLVYARGLDRDANVEAFLLALAELRDREWRAAVIGDGPARELAERTVRDLRIDDRVAFLGDLPDDERIPVLKGAHVFAQTATREPFATDLLWALACGCVGIAEYQAGSAAHELLEGKPRGELVTNPQEFADAIETAATLDHWTVDDDYVRYDHGEVVDRYLACYRDVVDDYGLL